MKYPQTAISEVANFINGFPFKPSDWCSTGYKIIRIQNLCDHSKPFNRTQKEVPARYLVKRGDILVSWSATIDVFEWDDEDAYLNQHIFKVDYNPYKVDKQYFKLSLKNTVRELVKFAHGSTMKHVVKGDFDNHQIPLPPLDDQIRIATLLSNVENLICRRREQLKQLDELLKSVFLEMFGDPVRNEMGWKTVPFSTILKDIESGWSPVCEARSAFSSEWGVLKLGAITSCVFKDDENKALLPDVQPKTKNEVQAGDLLFSRKNTYDLVAACVYVFNTRSKLMLSDLIFRFVFNDDSAVTPLYIWKLIINASQRKKIQSLAGGAAGSMPNISKANLRNIQIPLPPLDLQNRFSDIVIKVETLKAHYAKSLTNLEVLYGTLSQKAFKGELDLSRVPIIERTVSRRIGQP
jgi:type I restriction enzyme, S subunit